MNTELTNYDARQLRLMLEGLDAFGREAIALRDLISNLEGLLGSLESVDDPWRNAFLKKWGVLEDVYANAIDKSFPTIPTEHLALANRAIVELRRLIMQRLESEKRKSAL